MATRVQSTAEVVVSGTSGSVALTVTAGNRLIATVIQNASAIRTYTAADDVNGAWPAADVAQNTSQALVILSKPSAAAGVTTVTVTVSATTGYRFFVHEVSGVVATAPLTDLYDDTTTGNTQQCGATGITTATSGIVFAVGCLSAAATVCSVGAGWTDLVTGQTTLAVQQYKTFTSLSADVGDWSNTGTARIGDGAMAAYLDVAAPHLPSPVVLAQAINRASTY